VKLLTSDRIRERGEKGEIEREREKERENNIYVVYST
jgi:hypothetical protein